MNCNTLEVLAFPGSLHNHTDSSNQRLRDSINKVNSLIDRAIELNHSVCAITEHETISSAIAAEEYYTKIKEKNPNFKLILGNEIYLCRNGLNAENFNREKDRYYHFILLAKDAIGHQQIREISTRAWMRSYSYRKMIRVPTYYQDLYDIISANPGHVIASTACLGGLVGTQLLKYKDNQEEALLNKIENWCLSLQSLFGKENFFLEMQPSFNKEQIYVNNEIVKMSKKLNIPFIITNDAHYLKKEDIKIHSAFLKSQDGDRETESFYATTYLMSDQEIYEYMEKFIGGDCIQEAYSNINKITEMCEDYSLKKPLKIPRLNWKWAQKIKSDDILLSKIPYLETFLNSPYKEDHCLAQIFVERIKNDVTLQNERTYEEINACLGDIWLSSEVNNARWSAYMLNLQNIIDTCWDSGTLVGPGRGSGVGFIALYLLGITQINPLREVTKTFRFRFLNPARVSVLDVDIDIEGGKRVDVMKNFRKVYGEDRVANVLTLRTEKSKSAILTAARGLGIDVDVAQYLASMIESDRGQLRTLKQTFYGDEENGFAANKQFVIEMTENYPELWEVAQAIEGLICGIGVHAGGVIFVDEPFTNTAALMKSPKGEIITQFDLHAAEKTGLIKYDILSIEALDKMHAALDLLCEYNYIERKPTLKETYENTIGIYNLVRDDRKMWEMCWNHEVNSLFQMEKQSGIQGISAMKPTSVDDLSTLNSAIRLMAQEKGGEIPVRKLARFKEDSANWDKELREWGLGEKEKAILEPIVGTSYGLCIAQEQFMQLVQLPELGGFDLAWADRLRKSIAKKNPAEYEALTKEYYEVTKEKGCNPQLCKYVWSVLIAMSKGYGFNASHTLAYSLVGLQELNLAYRFPIIFWNCAVLIAETTSPDNDEDDDEIQIEESTPCQYENDPFEEDEDEEEEDEDSTETSTTATKKKKKVKATDYGKVATVIGKMKEEGVSITTPNINTSKMTFSPDVESNTIYYGLGGIARINKELAEKIIANRPYTSLQDFLTKIKTNKPQTINLIKAGCFDDFGEREELLRQYITIKSEPKSRLTLQNMPTLIKRGLIPPELDFQRRVYNFTSYIRKTKKIVPDYYLLDDKALAFYEANFDMDNIEFVGCARIKAKKWDKIYNDQMDKVRSFIKANYQELLDNLNQLQFNELWDKDCQGNLSKWEMDALSFYNHPHELSFINDSYYDIEDFSTLPEEPVVDAVIPVKEEGQRKFIPLLKITRIAGTVLARDKNKRTVTLLTKSGVVEVKIFGTVFASYDKRISEKDEATGKKKVIENSWFSRGNKLIITGIRRDNMFIAKKYKKTPYPLVEIIDKVEENGNLITRSERAELAE